MPRKEFIREKRCYAMFGLPADKIYNPTFGPVLLFVIAQLLLGCGGSPLFTLGTTYVDDHVLTHEKKKYEKPQSMLRLVTNPVYIVKCLGSYMEFMIVLGFVVFLPKYLKTQLSLGKSQASVFTGSIAIPELALAFLLVVREVAKLLSQFCRRGTELLGRAAAKRGAVTGVRAVRGLTKQNITSQTADLTPASRFDQEFLRFQFGRRDTSKEYPAGSSTATVFDSFGRKLDDIFKMPGSKSGENAHNASGSITEKRATVTTNNAHQQKLASYNQQLRQQNEALLSCMHEVGNLKKEKFRDSRTSLSNEKENRRTGVDKNYEPSMAALIFATKVESVAEVKAECKRAQKLLKESGGRPRHINEVVQESSKEEKSRRKR
uniref:Uncharacterized protein n=1 Tax=Glossina pallidipes TaxID=7398 RepID=A0A1A9ZQL1_GLOPL